MLQPEGATALDESYPLQLILPRNGLTGHLNVCPLVDSKSNQLNSQVPMEFLTQILRQDVFIEWIRNYGIWYNLKSVSYLYCSGSNSYSNVPEAVSVVGYPPAREG